LLEINLLYPHLCPSFSLSSTAQDIVTRIRENNQPAIPWDRVLGFPDRAASDRWLLENPDTALGAVHFLKDSSTGLINYILQSNSTVSIMDHLK
jgi:hypothetical protein